MTITAKSLCIRLQLILSMMTRDKFKLTVQIIQGEQRTTELGGISTPRTRYIFFYNMFIMYNTTYMPDWFCVPAFNCDVGDGLLLHQHKTLFNTVLAKPCVKSE